MGFTLSRHLCLGMTVNESLYQLADNCGMEDHHNTDDCDESEEWAIDIDDCCEDQWVSVAAVPTFRSGGEDGHLTKLGFIDGSPLLTLFQAAIVFTTSLESHWNTFLRPRASIPPQKILLSIWQRYLI